MKTLFQSKLVLLRTEVVLLKLCGSLLLSSSFIILDKEPLMKSSNASKHLKQIVRISHNVGMRAILEQACLDFIKSIPVSRGFEGLSCPAICLGVSISSK